MLIIGYLFGVLLTSLLGYFFVKLILKNSNYFYLIEFLIYSFLVGVFIDGFILFIMGLLGINIIITNIIVINFLLIFLFIFLNYFLKTKITFKKLNIITEFKKITLSHKILLVLGLILITFKLSFGFISIISLPTYQDDTFSNWNYRAKVFYERQSLVLNKEDKDYLGNGYKQYPLTPSLYKTYLANFYGEWNEGVVNSPSFIYFMLSLILLFFVVYRFSSSLSYSFLSMYILSSIPLYYIHGTNPYSDVMMGLYFFLAVYFTYLFIDGKVNIYATILFIGMLGYIKSEGLIIFTTAIIIGLFFINFIQKKLNKKSYYDMFKLIVGVIVINLPFLIFKIVHGLGFGNGDSKILDLGLSFHTEIFYPLYIAFFHSGAYNLLFLLFIIVFILWILKCRNKLKNSIVFLTSMVFAFLIILFVYLTTFNYQFVLDQTGINRSMMQITMLIVFTISLLFYEINHDK